MGTRKKRDNNYPNNSGCNFMAQFQFITKKFYLVLGDKVQC